MNVVCLDLEGVLVPEIWIAFAEESGYAEDFSDERLHHEIYLNDARRTAPEKLKTVIRHPVRRDLRASTERTVPPQW